MYEICTDLIYKYRWSVEAFEVGRRADFHCEYCDRDLLASVDDYDAWQHDHIVPQSRDGELQIENLALSCKTCNFIKGKWMPDAESFSTAPRETQITLVREYVQSKRASKLMEIAEMRKLIEELRHEND